MIEKPTEIQAAEWLIVGFVKHWYMSTLKAHLNQLGLGHRFEFLPRHEHMWTKASVRGFVAQEYPKLNEFLLKATPKQQVSAAAQIVKLRCIHGWAEGAIDRAERRELSKSANDYRRAEAEYRVVRRAKKTLGRSAWGVCK